MDVRSRTVEGKPPDDTPGSTALAAPNALTRAFGGRRLAAERAGQLLGEYKASELRLARSFPECRNLSKEELEDLYQETALALMDRRFQREEHLRSALREGIKFRALNLHRDERRREEILNHTGAHTNVMAQTSQDAYSPEQIALIHEDRLIADEFTTELSEDERRVFRWMVEGLQYRAIASVLEIPVNEARKTSRSCERKCKRFQLLYDTGRLCGYRADTIQALQSGESTSEELAASAFAHLNGCRRCRIQHKTNARRLRRSFRDQAAALLPGPVVAGHLGWLTRLDIRLRSLQHRLPLVQGGVRERAAALLAGGGATTKLALVGVATVAVIAGGTIGATHALEHPQTHHHQHTLPIAASPVPAATPADLVQGPTTPLTGARSPKHAGRTPHHQATTGSRHVPPGIRRAVPLQASTRREPGGFAYLGPPDTSAPPSAQPAPTTTHDGGPFSP